MKKDVLRNGILLVTSKLFGKYIEWSSAESRTRGKSMVLTSAEQKIWDFYERMGRFPKVGEGVTRDAITYWKGIMKCLSQLDEEQGKEMERQLSVYLWKIGEAKAELVDSGEKWLEDWENFGKVVLKG